MAVYTVDLGHTLSGGDTGAGGNGLREEQLTREIGNLVATGLRSAGHTVHIIQLDYARTMAESLNYRVDKIIGFNPTQSISIHINSAANPLATGVEVWGDNLCKDMCNRICGNISSQFNLDNRGFKHGVESLALVGLYGQSNVPALLVECFFICNANDCNKYNAQKYADCIVAGILNKPVLNNNNNNVEKVEYDMKNLVCYCNQVDKRAAEYLADNLKCPCMDATLGFDYKGVAENLIAVGGDAPTGKIGFSGYTTKRLKGDNRYETIKLVLKEIGQL